MKTLTLLILYLIIPFILTAQWYPQASGITENLSSIYFTDTLNGWTTGYNGTILHTDDGGENWEEQTINSDYYLEDVFFADPTHGWIVGSIDWWHSWYGIGKLYRTLDGGNNWEEMNIEDFPSKSVFFTDSLNGWAAGYGINHTSDGGETWETQFWTSGLIVRSVCYTDSLNGWAAGSHGVGSTGYKYSYILHSNDGGNTWEYQFYYGDNDGTYLYNIFFSDSLNGWSVGGSDGLFAIILKTTDGGNNWDTSYFESNTDELYSLYFIDSFNGWAVGQNGYIISTTDGGNTWESDSSSTNYHLNSVYFTKNGFGWIVGDEGTILHADYSQIVGLDEFETQSSITSIRCYPNPFSSLATFEYEVVQPGVVVIKIFNQVGKLIELIQRNDQKTENKLIWETNGLPAGVYFIQLQSGNEVLGRKIIKL